MQHFDVVQAIMVIMLGLISWFAIQSFQGILSRLDGHAEDINDMRNKHTELKAEVSELKGAHEATHPNYNNYR